MQRTYCPVVSLLIGVVHLGCGGGSEEVEVGTDGLCSGGVSRCVVTTQTPELQIAQSGLGTLFIVNGNAESIEQVQYSETLTGPIESFPVPAEAGLQPRQSYQWAFLRDGQPSSAAVWQSFTVDFVRAGREPVDTFGPLQVGLASQTVQTALQSQAVQTASGTVQLGLTHRGAFLGTSTAEPYFVEDPAQSLPSGWVLTGVDANVPWVRIEAVDSGGAGGSGGSGGAGGTGGSGGSDDTVRSVTLQAFDGSLLQYTNQGGGTGSWSPPVGLGRPDGAYGSLRQSRDGKTFTWTSGTSVVTFEQSSGDSGLWLASTAQVVLPGSSDISPGLQVSWDSEGRLSAIADQNSVNANKEATRVARFYYGGDSACPSRADLDPGYIVAPTGMLCAFEHLDGTQAVVQYVALNTSFETAQIGRVSLPDGATWSFSWGTVSVRTDSGEVTFAQLLSVQTPRGYDAQTQAAMAADDTVWSVVYESDPFGAATLTGLVSPLPTAEASAAERLGRFYKFADASVSWASITGSPGAFSLSEGATLRTFHFDAAWRRTSQTQFVDDQTSYTTTYAWDEALDQQTSVTFAGATQTQGYDFLGRPSTLTGPGTTAGTTTYDEGAVRGLVGTVYGNTTLEAPGSGSVIYAVTDGSGEVKVEVQSPPSGAGGGSFSMELSGYVAAPTAGRSPTRSRRTTTARRHST